MTSIATLAKGDHTEFPLPSQEVLSIYHDNLRMFDGSDEPAPEAEKTHLLTGAIGRMDNDPSFTDSRKESIRQRLMAAEDEPMSQRELLALQDLQWRTDRRAEALGRALQRGEGESDETYAAAKAAYKQAVRDATRDRRCKVPEGIEPPTLDGQSVSRVTAYGMYAAQCARGKSIPLGNSQCPLCGQFKSSVHDCPRTDPPPMGNNFRGGQLEFVEREPEVVEAWFRREAQRVAGATEDELAFASEVQADIRDYSIARQNGIRHAEAIGRSRTNATVGASPYNFGGFPAGDRESVEQWAVGVSHKFEITKEHQADLNRRGCSRLAYINMRDAGATHPQSIDAWERAGDPDAYSSLRRTGKSHEHAVQVVSGGTSRPATCNFGGFSTSYRDGIRNWAQEAVQREDIKEEQMERMEVQGCSRMAYINMRDAKATDGEAMEAWSRIGYPDSYALARRKGVKHIHAMEARNYLDAYVASRETGTTHDQAMQEGREGARYSEYVELRQRTDTHEQAMRLAKEREDTARDYMRGIE